MGRTQHHHAHTVLLRGVSDAARIAKDLRTKKENRGRAESKMAALSSVIKPGKTAVVTGASSGIGKAACLAFAKAGMHVWLVDIDAKELEVASSEIKGMSTGGKVISKVVDVSSAVALQELAKEVFSVGKCHILMNNAGIGQGGGAMTDMSIVEKVMGVNTYGPIHGCVAMVPLMKECGEECFVINTGSKQGITMPPGNLIYNMSKSALKCYTEGLEHELMLERAAGKHKVKAVLLVPGWVNTSILLKSERAKAEAKGETYDDTKAFFSEAKPASGAWGASQVIDFLVEEVDAGRFYVICPDNDVDRHTDNLRMTWTMQDITQNRPPLSRWHPDYKDAFSSYLAAHPK